MNNKVPQVPQGYNTVNPFIITKDSQKLIAFLTEVFGAVENKDAFTKDDDGLVIHSEVTIGNSVIMIADRKEKWPFTPGFMQIYVKDVNETLEKAKKLNAKIITNPTEFYETSYSRFQDEWGNIWWVYQQLESNNWELPEGDDTDQWSQKNDAVVYFHDTLVEAMDNLKE